MPRKRNAVKQKPTSVKQPAQRNTETPLEDEASPPKNSECLSCQLNSLLESEQQYSFKTDHLPTIEGGIQSANLSDAFKEEMLKYVGTAPDTESISEGTAITNKILRKELKKNRINPDFKVWGIFVTYYTAMSVLYSSKLLIDGNFATLFKCLFCMNTRISIYALHRAFVSFHSAQLKIEGKPPALFANFPEIESVSHETLVNRDLQNAIIKGTDPVKESISNRVTFVQSTEVLPIFNEQLNELMSAMLILFVKFNLRYNKYGIITPAFRKMFLFLLGKEAKEFYYFNLTQIDSLLGSILGMDDRIMSSVKKSK